MAIEQHIEASDGFFVGTDYSIVFTVYQSDGTTAQNITGWSLSWMLKRKQSDADAAAKLTKTTVSGIVLTTPASGICTVSIADTDTDSIAAGTYYHELKRTDASSETVLSYGTCVLMQSVHRT